MRRRLICKACPFNSNNAENYKSDRIDEHCIMCGCTITRKTAALTANCGIDCCNYESQEECDCKNTGLKSFNQKNKINMPLKWSAYKKEENEQQEESAS
mgnify:CR=1 FL=1